MYRPFHFLASSKKGYYMHKSIIVLMLSIGLSGCGGGKLNPFSDKAKTNTDYQSYTCNENKQFKLKIVNKRQNAWLMLADHEVYLTRQEQAEQQYSNDRYVLTLNEEQVTITDVGDLQYAGCHTMP